MKNLYFRMSNENQEILDKDCLVDVTNTIKSESSVVKLLLLDALIVWMTFYPNKDFNFDKFKQLFNDEEPRTTREGTESESVLQTQQD